MRIGIWQEHFAPLSVEETFSRLADLGYDAVQVTPWTFSDVAPAADPGAVERVGDAAAAAGIDVDGVARVFGAHEGYHIGHADAAVRERTVSYLVDLIGFCGALGGSVLTFGSPRQRSVPAGSTSAEAWDRAVGTIGDPAVTGALEAAGVELGIEPLQAGSTDFINTTPEAVAFVEAVDHPNVRLTVDGYHLIHEPDPIPELIRAHGHLLCDFHADDATGRGPGAGDLDYGPIIEALDDVGYAGPVTVELHALLGDDVPEGLDPLAMARRSLETLRSG